MVVLSKSVRWHPELQRERQKSAKGRKRASEADSSDRGRGVQRQAIHDVSSSPRTEIPWRRGGLPRHERVDQGKEEETRKLLP